ncbi:hypothetical protein ACHAWF_002999 [Thalassiosira exigua]
MKRTMAKKNRARPRLSVVCMLAFVSPTAAAKTPIKDKSNGLSTSASAKREGASRSRNVRSTLHMPGHHEASSAALKNATSVEEPESSSALTPSRPSFSIGLGAGGSLSVFQSALSQSRLFVTVGTQIAIGWAAYYLAKASWSVMMEVWEEVNEEFATARKGKGGEGDVREEQDMPYADKGFLSGGLGRGQAGGDESDDSDKEDEKKRWRVQTPQITATRELAARLRSAGIPYASEISTKDANGSTRSVEDVVRSLTRSEGNVLAQTLLTPLDGGIVGSDMDSSAAAAADAWNAIGGLSKAKESLLDLAFPLLPRSDTGENDYYGGLLANPPGVLLYGPPGCGKSMLVRALAATVGARFLVVSPSCLLRKYVGETNLNVRALFTTAHKISPVSHELLVGTNF